MSRPHDLRGLSRQLKAFGYLQMTLAVQEIVGWGGGFALRK